MGWQSWQLDGFTGHDKGQLTTDGSQTNLHDMHSAVMVSPGPTTGVGQRLDLSGGSGTSQSTTTPGGFDSGSVTTGTQQGVSLTPLF